MYTPAAFGPRGSAGRSGLIRLLVREVVLFPICTFKLQTHSLKKYLHHYLNSKHFLCPHLLPQLTVDAFNLKKDPPPLHFLFYVSNVGDLETEAYSTALDKSPENVLKYLLFLFI